MSKKDLNGDLASQQPDHPSPKRGRPVSPKGTKEREIRATFILNEKLLEQIKAIAYWDRLLIKDVVSTALQHEVDKYEKRNGAIISIPKK
jgi:hypothetical protein